MNKPNLAPLTIDVVSDVVCPWCYLGKYRLEAALRLIPEIPVAVIWRPFQLDPSVPPEGMDRKAYMIGKFGSLDAIAPAHERLTAMGREVGIDYRFDDMERAANTLDAHRLIRWAAAEGKQTDVVERLFRANFTEVRDIGNPDVLADIAGEAGMDRAIVAKRLASDEDKASVREEIDEAQRIGVTGVPCFIIDRKYAIAGAHPAEAIADAIRKAAAERTPTAVN
jgi:predicted DsbA family dithiol-disulfide isomerase